MRTTVRLMVAVSWMLALSAGVVRAEDATQPAQPPMDPAKQAAMEAMQKLGSPGEAHKIFEPLVGKWSYTGQMWMSADGQPDTMTGTATNSLAFGGRFLKQEFTGTMAGNPQPFEGLGYTGYDNIRKEYQSIWLDNMSTGVMMSTGQNDPAAGLTLQGDFSCPMTGEAHRTMKSIWKITDPDHNTYESWMNGKDGKPFKAMEIKYTRAQ